MGGLEGGGLKFNPDILPQWQKEIELGLVYLTRDQQALRNTEFRSPEEESLVWKVAQRVRNLTDVFKNSGQPDVDNVPDHIRLSSVNPRFRRIYNTQTHEIRDIPIKTRFGILKVDDGSEESVLVIPDMWARNEELVDSIKSSLISLVNRGNRDTILAAFELDMQPIDITE